MPRRKRPDELPAPTKTVSMRPVEPTRDAVEANEESLLRVALGVPDGEALTSWVRKNLRVSNPFGLRAALGLAHKPDKAASELLHHRARVRLRDGAALCVPAYLDELASRKPNSARLEGMWRLLKATGLVTETAPVDPHERARQDARSMEIAGLDRASLAKRILDRIRATNPEPKEGR